MAGTSFRRKLFAFAIVLFLGRSGLLSAQELSKEFEAVVRPFLTKYCLDCHGSLDPEAKLDLSPYQKSEDVAKAHGVWKHILDRLESEEMPPKDSDQPEAVEREAITKWIVAMRRAEAKKNAGDPGPVLVRRLSNAEYNYSIRDLTGIDIRPAATFPVDPANKSGFDNSGESLNMSPALLTRYLGAARQVAAHMVLTPTGITFAPHPAITDTDRDKFCVKRIVQFYQKQPTDLADYLFAAWKVRVMSASASPAKLQQIASEESVSPKYLKTVVQFLESENDLGPAKLVRTTWLALPDDLEQASKVKASCRSLRDSIVKIRDRLRPLPADLYVEGSHKGSQPFVLWKNRQYAAGRRSFDIARLKTETKIGEKSAVAQSLSLPADPSEQKKFLTSLEEFCRVFPDEFYVSERGRDYVESSKKQQGERGRLLSAGFHSMMGYFRDDRPLYDLILSREQQRELDSLWQELDFVASAPMRQYVGFLWFERTDSRFMRDEQFDFARPENRSSQSPENIKRLAKVYLDKAEQAGGGKTELGAIQKYFDDINAQIRWVATTREKSAPIHLESIIELANRAWRRPLTPAESDDLRQFYSLLRQDGLTHEEAIQDCFVSILVSPKFSFRLDVLAKGEGTQPLSAIDLASRLSYFLWSSMPDKELLALANDGRLLEKEILLQQVSRMLEDQRVAGMATEFGGNWLDFRRFEEHQSVDRKRFPQFTDELREAMFQEPIRFLTDLFQRDGTVKELLGADHTFVNQTLARHYEIPKDEIASATNGKWVRVDNASRFGRGGLLPMAVFLTKNSPGLRTSPVKRGYWVVRRLLGERIPPPPPDVPELPADESALGELTLTEVLARHREHVACAGCHNRIDGAGIAFEGFGPIGERRDKDLGGRPVIQVAEFPGGIKGSGVDGLREYLNAQRKDEFIDNLCRKLLSYALGRTLILSDDLLIEEMKADLKRGDQRISNLITTIVTSPQFLNSRKD